MSVPVSFRWDEEFVRRVDEARGDVPRSRFVRRAVEAQLTPTGPLEQVEDQRAFIPLTEEALVAAEQARKPSEDPGRHRADYTLPVPRVRSSAAARPFRPAPKGKA